MPDYRVHYQYAAWEAYSGTRTYYLEDKVYMFDEKKEAVEFFNRNGQTFNTEGMGSLEEGKEKSGPLYIKLYRYVDGGEDVVVAKHGTFTTERSIW